MVLTLLAVSLNEQPLTQPITARFDAAGGTIGRADHNTMALPDPERHISRLQAEVVLAGDAFLIRNVGAANPIAVGARSLVHGDSAPLTPADPVRIGGYLLRVSLADDDDLEQTRGRAMRISAAATPVPATPRPVMAVSSGNPFAGLLGVSPGAAGADPYADLMPAAPAGVAKGSSALATPPAPPPARLPDDFDPFAPPSAPTPAPAAAADPFADLLPKSASIDEAFGLDRGGADPLAAFLGDAARPAASGGLPTDPLALFGDTPAAPEAYAERAATQRDDLPALHAAFAPPRVREPAAPAVGAATPRPRPPSAIAALPDPPAPAPASASAGRAAPGGSGDAALWAAFCDGAGIALPPPADAAERMHTAGRILRSALEGTLQLMSLRASTRQELRATVTVIQQRSNNPLKFTPDAQSGVEQLLQPPARGFLDGPAAMADAMRDLVGHSVGTVVGMRAAIEGMLDRFDPAALEAQLSKGSMLDSLLPMARRARLWDLYLEHHRAIRDEAQEDFHTLFGKAFMAAYEEQVERLKNEAAAP